MKKHKAFTLVEMVVCISLLAVLGIVIVINLNNGDKKNDNEEYAKFVKKIEASSDTYLSDNKEIVNTLENEKGYVLIKIKDLQEVGLLSDDVINPKTSKKVDSNEDIMVSLDESGLIKYTYPVVDVTEDYLSVKNLRVEYKSKLFSGDNACFKDLDTSNLAYVSKNGDYVKGYLRKDDNIKCEGNIDTSKPGSYKFTYTYTLKDTRVSKRVTRNVIVSERVKVELIASNGKEMLWVKNFSLNYKFNRSVNYGNITWKIDDTSNSNGTSINSINGKHTYSISSDVIEDGEVLYSVNASYRGYADNINPTISNVSARDENNNELSSGVWATGKITIRANALDNGSILEDNTNSGILSYYIGKSSCSSASYRNITDSSGVISLSNISSNGTYYICTKDRAGNIASTTKSITSIDTIKPTTSYEMITTSYVRYNVSVKLKLNDNESKVVGYYVSSSSTTPTKNSSWTTFTATNSKEITYGVTSNGTYYFWAIDQSGNISNRNSFYVYLIDNTPPTVSLHADMSSCSSSGFWFNFNIDSWSDDRSGIDPNYSWNVSYSRYNRPSYFVSYSTSVDDLECGEVYYVWVRVYDKAGNVTYAVAPERIYCSACVYDDTPYYPPTEPSNPSSTSSTCSSGSKYYIYAAGYYWCIQTYDALTTSNGSCPSGYKGPFDSRYCCQNGLEYNNSYTNIPYPCLKQTGSPKCPSGKSLSSDKNSCS